MGWLQVLQTVVVSVVVPVLGVVLGRWAAKNGKLADTTRYTAIAVDVVAAILAQHPNLTALQIADQALHVLQAQLPQVDEAILRRIALGAVTKIKGAPGALIAQ
jgi:hypothetical protein